MKSIIERLKQSVEFAEKEGENMDDISWEMQEGILISYNDAKKIMAYIRKLESACKEVVKGYEGDGFEGMRERDNVFYRVCMTAINPQTIEDHEANSVRGIEAYTEQQLKNFEAETSAAINEVGGCSTCGDITGFNCICQDDMWFEENDFEPCDLCERQDSCSSNGCFLRKYTLID